MQRCRCEEHRAYEGVDCPSGLHLCYLCASEIAGGTSRWAWHACESCVKFNRYLASTFGFRLPLGRHSIMNSIAIPIHGSEEEQKKAIEAMIDFLDVAGSIEDWGQLQVRELFESVHSWKKERLIPLAKWQAKFQLSKVKATSRSEQAFKDYLRVNEFEELVR
jgi:hypothetical protein